MFRENIENAKMNLQGRIFKCFFVILSSYVSFFVFVSSSFCCIYLLIINIEFLSVLGVFENQYIHAAVCAFAVVENIILFILHIYTRLKKDIYICFNEEMYDTHIPVRIVYKACCAYFLKVIKKSICCLLYISPFTVISVLIYSFLQDGMSYFLLILFVLSDVVLLITGLYSYFVFTQKYEMMPFVLMKNHDKSIRDIFVLSATLMNGKCRNLLRLKLQNIPKKLLCLFIFPCVYFLPYCKAVEADYIVSKEKPYMRRKAYTEKPIVFYFKPIKER